MILSNIWSNPFDNNIAIWFSKLFDSFPSALKEFIVVFSALGDLGLFFFFFSIIFLIIPQTRKVGILLSISLVRGINSSIIVLQTLTFSFFIIFSILSAVYHLFSVNHQRTSRVLLLIRQFLLIVTLFLLTATITELQQGSMFLILFFLLLSVLSLFLSLLSTKGGLRAGNIIIAVIGVVLMISFRDAYITFISLSIVINGLINALFDSDKAKLAGRVKTTSLFYLLSLLFFFLFSEHLLIAF